MASTSPGYGGFGVRQRAPGNARHVTPEVLAQESNQRILAAAQAALAEPFVGLTSDGAVTSGLFPVRPSGVSTGSIVDAAQVFLRTLHTDDAARASFAVDAPEWRQWANNTRPIGRHGLLFEDMSPTQRVAALEMVRASLSARGFETVHGIMKLNQTLADITGYHSELGEWIYFLSLFGHPSADQPWGWQIDGHHLIVNCFLLGDQIVLSPSFMGAEPAVADRGAYAGTRVLDEEQQRGLELVRALTPAQRGAAIKFDSVLARNLPPGRVVGGDGRILAGAHKDNLVVPYEGVRADSFSPGQQELLLDLIHAYVGRVGAGHDEVKMAEARQHLSETYFTWLGRFGDDDVFYYRVHSPVLLIEFDHQSGVFFSNDEPARFHMHTVVRTPNGNDYGRDLLRQHYLAHHGAGELGRNDG